MKTIDLHTHSDASDGSLRPEELVQAAAKAGLAAVALTDHDSVEGVAAARTAAENAGVELVAGVELGAAGDAELHILGYFIDPDDAELAGQLSLLRDWRAQRNADMLQKLGTLDMPLDADFVCKFTGCTGLATMGRAHMARAMVKKGYVKTMQEAFDRFLAGGGPAYVERRRLDAAACIGLIHRAGGVAVLAHPVLLDTEDGKLDAMVAELAAAGLDGLECYHTSQDDAHAKQYLCLAAKHGLLPTGGSDFHGDNKPGAALGLDGAGRHILYGLLAQLMQRKGA